MATPQQPPQFDDDVVPFELLSDRPLIDSFTESDAESDDSLFAELSLLSEYEPDLHQPLTGDIEPRDDITRELRISELIAAVQEVDAAQQAQLKELLREFGAGKWRWWYRWMLRQSWTGQSLLLFIRFWEVWDASNDWWETTYWDHRASLWWVAFNRSALSLDDAYLLVQRRLGCRPSEVVDGRWLEEWLDARTWRYGHFFSFAEYAVGRAAYPDKTEWNRYLRSLRGYCRDY